MSQKYPDFPIAVAQLATQPGDVRKKLGVMLDAIKMAKANGARMIVFPELATSDYLLGDRWEYDDFIREIDYANQHIRIASSGIVVIWGSVVADFSKIGEDGRTRKYNAACIAHNGRWISNGILNGFMPKTNMPKYRMFDDERHFYPATKLAAEMGRTLESFLEPFPVTIDGQRYYFAIGSCEDYWEDEYNAKPSRIYRTKQVDLGIDLSQSPWTFNKWKARDRMLRNRVADMGAPMLYVNSVGLQNNAKNLIWFDGGSCLMGHDGRMLWTGKVNEAEFARINLSELFSSPKVKVHTDGIREKYEAGIAAMRDFYRDHRRVIIGLSGGIDSAVSLAMHANALGSGRTLSINMPTKFNSSTTKSLAYDCASRIGSEYRVVPIQELFEAHLRSLAKAQYPNPSKFDMENVQARIRGVVQADISASESTRSGGKCTFSCNGNKTEVALNYFTLYGDGAGGSAFFSDFWKGEMYLLAHYMNELAGEQLIPQGIIDIVPSAELSADQNVDEGKGDPIFYPFHDNLLRAFTEKRWGPTKIIDLLSGGVPVLEQGLGCEPGVVKRFFPAPIHLVDSIEWAWNQYSYEGKRHMLPSGFITSRRAFGFDRRDVIAPGYLTDTYERLKKDFLQKHPSAF